MTDRGLIGAVLYAKDLQRLVNFYAAVAGVGVQKSEQGFAVLDRKPSQLVIVHIPQNVADTIDIATPPVPGESTPIKLVFAVDDIASARLRAAERGGVINAIEREWDFEGPGFAMAMIRKAMCFNSDARAEARQLCCVDGPLSVEARAWATFSQRVVATAHPRSGFEHA